MPINKLPSVSHERTLLRQQSAPEPGQGHKLFKGRRLQIGSFKATANDRTMLDSQLIDYLLRRAACKKAVSPDQAIALKRATDAVIEARALIKRSNVQEDVNLYGQELSYKARAARRLQHDLDSDPMLQIQYGYLQSYHNLITAVTSALVGAGDCKQHASLTAHLYSGYFDETGKQPESVDIVYSQRAKHSWSQVNFNQDPTNRIIIDAWVTGPAVLTEDYLFNEYPLAIQNSLQDNQRLNLKSLLESLWQMPLTHKSLEYYTQEYIQEGSEDEHLWESTEAYSEHFINSSNKALERMLPLDTQILNAGVYRALGFSVHQATAEANQSSH